MVEQRHKRRGKPHHSTSLNSAYWRERYVKTGGDHRCKQTAGPRGVLMTTEIKRYQVLKRSPALPSGYRFETSLAFSHRLSALYCHLGRGEDAWRLGKTRLRGDQRTTCPQQWYAS